MRTGAGSKTRNSDDVATLGRREERKQALRRALLESALALFEERGFDATTIDAIAQRAGSSRRTFFRYFEGKESVLFDGQARRLAEFTAHLAPIRPREPVVDRVGRAVSRMVSVYSEDRDEVLTVQRIVARSATLSGIELGFDDAWERALVDVLRSAPERRAREDAAVDAGILVGGLRAALRVWIASGGRRRLDELAERTMHRLSPLLAERRSTGDVGRPRSKRRSG